MSRRGAQSPSRQSYNTSASGQSRVIIGDIANTYNNTYNNYAGSTGTQRLTDAALLAAGVSILNWAFSSSSDPETDSTFPSYRQRENKFFNVGKVFEVLWTQPAGFSPEYIPRYAPAESRGRFGQKNSSETRMFVVIRTGNYKSTCLPILNYGPKGASKPGILRSHHGIVYTGKPAPYPTPEESPQRGEKGLCPTPIHIVVDEPGTCLNEPARINYDSVYTIEHNVKVKPFGKVHECSMTAFVYQFRKVWFSEESEGESDSEETHSSGAEASSGDEQQIQSREIPKSPKQLNGPVSKPTAPTPNLDVGTEAHIAHLAKFGYSRAQAIDYLQQQGYLPKQVVIRSSVRPP